MKTECLGNIPTTWKELRLLQERDTIWLRGVHFPDSLRYPGPLFPVFAPPVSHGVCYYPFKTNVAEGGTLLGARARNSFRFLNSDRNPYLILRKNAVKDTTRASLPTGPETKTGLYVMDWGVDSGAETVLDPIVQNRNSIVAIVAQSALFNGIDHMLRNAILVAPFPPQTFLFCICLQKSAYRTKATVALTLSMLFRVEVRADAKVGRLWTQQCAL